MADDRDIESMMREVEETNTACMEAMGVVNASRAKRGEPAIDWRRQAPRLDPKDPSCAAPTEATVLGAVMILGRKNLPTEAAGLSVECFTQKPYAYIWQWIEDCLTEGLDCDEVTVWDRIIKDPQKPEGISFHFHCLTATCPSVVNLGHWASILINESVGKRKEIRIHEIMSSDLDPDIKAAEMQRLLMESAPKSDSIKHVKTLLSPWLTEFEAEKMDPEAGVAAKTGIPCVDKKTKLKAGEMTILAARPGMGKSALAGNIAAHCAKHGDVAMFSLEMTSTAVITRLVTSTAMMHLGGKIKDHQWGRITNSLAKVRNLGLWLDDRAGLSVSEMRAALMRVPKTRLIVVDYLGLMAEDKKSQRHDLAVGGNARDLRALAKDLGAHVIVLCQLNRKVEDRDPPVPGLADLRDSGNLEEHADNVWFIYRPAYYDEKADNTAQILIEKQRHGEPHLRIEAKWDGPTQRFYDEETKYGEPEERIDTHSGNITRGPSRDWAKAAAGEKEE